MGTATYPMLRILLLVLWGLSVSGVCKGQNWRPFKQGATSAYQCADTSIIIPRVASIERLPNGDSLGWFTDLPKYDIRCQAAYKIAANPHSPFGTYYRFSKGFVVFYTKDSTQALSDSLLLDARVSVGNRYRSGTFQVRYVGTRYEPVLGSISDSVRAFEVGGAIWRWSKSYGLTEAAVIDNEPFSADNWDSRPSTSWGQRGSTLKLVGHDGLSGSHAIPNAVDMIPYHIGDSLGYYRVEKTLFSGNWYPNKEVWTRTVVLSVRYDSARKSVNVYMTGKAFVFNRRIGFGPNCCRDTAYNLDRYEEVLELRNTWRDRPYSGALLLTDDYDDIQSPIMHMRYEGDSTGFQLKIQTAGPGFRADSCYQFVVDFGNKQTYVSGIGLIEEDRIGSMMKLESYWINGRGVRGGALPTATRVRSMNAYRLAVNPVSTQLEVVSPTPLHLTLQDLQARTVAEGWDTRTLDVRVLPPGLYQLRVQDKQGSSQVLRVAKD